MLLHPFSCLREVSSRTHIKAPASTELACCYDTGAQPFWKMEIGRPEATPSLVYQIGPGHRYYYRLFDVRIGTVIWTEAVGATNDRRGRPACLLEKEEHKTQVEDPAWRAHRVSHHPSSGIHVIYLSLRLP